MSFEAFADHRREIFRDADGIVRPLVRAALQSGGRAKDWEPVIDAATNLWLSILTDEAPDAFPDRIVRDFRADLRKSLHKTAKPDDPPTDSQVERVTMWLGTYTVNSATWYAGRAAGDRTKVWITMHDGLVRPIHHVVDGQVRQIGGTFDVGGHNLRFPGEPIGPPEVWINCRCIIAPGGDRAMAAAATTAVPEDEITEPLDPDVPVDADDPDDLEEVDIEGEELVDDPLTEIPVHGIAAPMGVPTGDGRMFADGALTWRQLPLPIRYEYVSNHGGNETSEVVTVGRIDDMWVDEATNMVRYRGAIVLSKDFADAVIEGVIDGTVRGISVEVDDIAVDVEADRERARAILSGQPDQSEAEALSDEEIDALIDQMVGDGTQPITTFTAARICGFTIVPIPAYEEAYVALGEAFEDELTDEDREVLAACGCAGQSEGDDAFRDVSTEERKKLADKGNALPDGSFPIANLEDLKNAIQAIGRAKDPEAAKRHIKKRARELGHEELIPEDWSLSDLGLYAVLREDESGSTRFGPFDTEDDAREWIANEGGDGEFTVEHLTAVVAAATFAPGTKDGPGWITHPRATARIRRYWVRGKGAAKIKWGAPGDFNRCRRQLAKYVRNPNWLAGLCANMHKEALGFWPGEHHGSTIRSLRASAHGEPGWGFSIRAAAHAPLPAAAFKPTDVRPGTGLVVDDDRVYGYLAEWGVCHIGIPGVCTTAPHSASGYHYFATGWVETDEGEIPVGQITMDTGHAAINAKAHAAASHYDNTGAVVADVAIGEDNYGIWVAGLLRPGVTDEQRRALKASGRLSGDWRTIGTSGLELVAALAVNVPGFPIPKVALAASAGEQLSLVAAGIVADNPEPVVASGALDADAVAAISRAAVAEYINEQDRRARVEASREKRAAVKSSHLAALRARITKEN